MAPRALFHETTLLRTTVPRPVATRGRPPIAMSHALISSAVGGRPTLKWRLRVEDHRKPKREKDRQTRSVPSLSEGRGFLRSWFDKLTTSVVQHRHIRLFRQPHLPRLNHVVVIVRVQPADGDEPSRRRLHVARFRPSRDATTVSWPSHSHGRRKRVCARGRIGSCSVASFQAWPPSTDTSTRVTALGRSRRCPAIS